jgi:3-methylcrotonyl-CoA carboxylase beta subunit
MIDRVSDLHARREHVVLGGGERSVARHRSRGKLFVRDRISTLLDPGSEFLELSQLAALGMYGGDVPSAGIVTGIGSVSGQLCMIVGNDATVKGGTYFPASVRKHLRAQQIAEENHLPCIYLVDSGGAHLPLQAEMFADRDHGGRFFRNQARMSAAGIPQVACVMGSCTAGGAYVPAMCDETVIVDGTGSIYLAGPPLVKAATGEDVTSEELGGADVHTRISGVADHMAADDESALARVREIVEHLRLPTNDVTVDAVVDPTRDAIELNNAAQWRALDIVSCIVDGGTLHRFKEPYGAGVVAGFAQIMGRPVALALIADDIDDAGASTVAHLAELVAQRETPLVTFEMGSPDGVDRVGRHRARAAAALSLLETPIVTIVTSGSGDVVRALPYKSRMIWSWPGDGDTSIEGADSSYAATARLVDDGMIAPSETRRVVALSLAAMTAHSHTRAASNPVIRM